MRGRFAILIVANFVLMSTSGIGFASADDEQPAWRSVGIDPLGWNDGPVEEASPMNKTYQGNAIFQIHVSYVPELGASRMSGTITLELFEQWAPITTSNMIKNIESDIYTGIFFHRVIDDFVTQAGDPTCKKLGFYPVTNPECGSGGTGTTIPLEHDDNLSHVDGAIGMARGQEQDSADSQWYIAETEAHGLDPENRNDGGYATFGIVRDGMSHVRAIANVPTSDDPTGDADIENPFSFAGRPVNEVLIVTVDLVGVSDPDGTLRGISQTQEQSGGLFSFLQDSSGALFSGGFIVALLVVIVCLYIARIDPPLSLEEQDVNLTLDAVLIE